MYSSTVHINQGDNATNIKVIKDHFTNMKADQMDYYSSSINLPPTLKSKLFGFPDDHFDHRKKEQLYLFNYPTKGKILVTEEQLDKLSCYENKDDSDHDS